MDYLPGFVNIPDGTVEINQNNNDTTKKKSSKKSGGFQSMNISFNVIKGITKRGYKQPTPIQRKVYTTRDTTLDHLYTYALLLSSLFSRQFL